MANNNENVLINVEISASGQQQLNQYKGAFDSLRNSIDGLSSPISKLDADISKLGSSINQLGAQNNTFVESVFKINSTFLSLQDVVNGVRTAFSALRTGALSLETALTGGLAIVLAFLPQIMNLVSSFIKGKDAVSVMTNNLKNMNEVMKATNSSVSEEVSKLNVLYRSATDANKPAAERLKYVKQLKSEYPGFLKNMSDEDVMNGKAKKNLDELTKSIIANVKAEIYIIINLMTGKCLFHNYSSV